MTKLPILLAPFSLCTLLCSCTTPEPQRQVNYSPNIFNYSAEWFHATFLSKNHTYELDSTNPRDYILSKNLAWGVPTSHTDYILSPWAPKAGYVFVGNYVPLDVVVCPYSKKYLLVPDRTKIKAQKIDKN